MPLTKINFSQINSPGPYYGQAFGLVGDGTTDDTTALQTLFTAANNARATARLWGLQYKISGPLTAGGINGIDMEGLGVNSGDAGIIKVTFPGAGYRALTVGGVPNVMNVSICAPGGGGTTNTGQGIKFDQISIGRLGKVYVDGFWGIGFTISQSYDFTAESLASNNSGNPTAYAFEIVDGAGTSNEFHIGHLQVELANSSAIYISPNSSNFVIDSIHSERATPLVARYTWVLGGSNCVYNMVRLTSLAPTANASCYLPCSYGQFNLLKTEGSIVVTAEGVSGDPITLINPHIEGTLQALTNQIGLINIFGGTIAILQGQASRYNIDGTTIGTLSCGVATNDPTLFKIANSTIGILTNSSSDSALTMTNCTADVNSASTIGGRGALVMDNCIITGGGNLALSECAADIRNSVITCTSLNCIGVSAISQRFSRTQINGNLVEASDNNSSIWGPGCRVTGTVSAAYLKAPTQGTWVVGDVHFPPKPVVGSPWYFTCTVAGNPGTWVAGPNL